MAQSLALDANPSGASLLGTDAPNPPRSVVLATRVRLTQAILNCEIRRTVVERLKGRVRRRVSALVSSATQIKPKLRSTLWWRAVSALVLRWSVTPLGRRTVAGAIAVATTQRWERPSRALPDPKDAAAVASTVDRPGLGVVNSSTNRIAAGRCGS